MTKHERGEPSKIDMVGLDIDLDMIDLYEGEPGKHIGLVQALKEAMSDEDRLSLVTAYLRLAYSRGYLRAVTEPQDDMIVKGYGSDTLPGASNEET